MVGANISMKLPDKETDCPRHFLILNELKTLNHGPLWATTHPGLPEIVPVHAYLSGILINKHPFSSTDIFFCMINDMNIFNIYQNAKGISHLIVSVIFENQWRSGTMQVEMSRCFNFPKR